MLSIGHTARFSAGNVTRDRAQYLWGDEGIQRVVAWPICARLKGRVDNGKVNRIVCRNTRVFILR